MLVDGAVAGFEQQVAIAIKLKLAGAFDVQTDGIRIGAWGNHVVIFELLLIPVVNQIDARIKGLVLHTRVIGDVLAPLRLVLAHEVVRDGTHTVHSSDLGRWIRSHGPDMDDSLILGPRIEHEDGLIGRQKETILGAP